MSRLHTLTAVATAALTLAAAPSALAKTDVVGHAGTPNTNVCLAQLECTYVNYHHGAPSDVVRHGGTITSWTLNEGGVGGDVTLRVLRPAGNGRLRFVRSSHLEHTSSLTGTNTFSTHLKVRRGDVLGLTNDTSGLYMSAAPAGTCVRYFDYDQPQTDGTVGKTKRTMPQLHLELSAKVKRS